MPIAITCQHCDWKGKVADTLGGKKGKCPTCGELVPIPKRAAPPPVPGKKAVDNEPDVVDDADIVEEVEERPSKSRPAARRRPDDDDRPARSRRRVDDDDEDERPSRSRRRPADADDEDERPSRVRRRPADDDDEDERPSRSRRRDDDDEDEDRPRKKRSGPKKRRPQKSGMGSKRIGAIVGGIFALVVGGALLAWFLMGDGRRIVWPIILIIGGLIGLFQGATGVGLSEDDE
jgi:hypothetical protein